MNANEPAYPDTITMGPHGEVCRPEFSGLTKRELIAAMAMQGLLANSGYADAYNDKHAPALTKLAATYADALILELSKENSK